MASSMRRCPICVSEYDAVNKRPLVLSCGHTFCHDCLYRMSAHTYRTCAVCRKSWSDRTVNELPECYQLLPTDVTSDVLQCRIHNTSLLFWCVPCSEKLCRKCLRQQHRGCEWVLLEEQANELKTEMMQKVADTEAAIKESLSSIENIIKENKTVLDLQKNLGKMLKKLGKEYVIYQQRILVLQSRLNKQISELEKLSSDWTIPPGSDFLVAIRDKTAELENIKAVLMWPQKPHMRSFYGLIDNFQRCRDSNFSLTDVCDGLDLPFSDEESEVEDEENEEDMEDLEPEPANDHGEHVHEQNAVVINDPESTVLSSSTVENPSSGFDPPLFTLSNTVSSSAGILDSNANDENVTRVDATTTFVPCSRSLPTQFSLRPVISFFSQANLCFSTLASTSTPRASQSGTDPLTSPATATNALQATPLLSTDYVRNVATGGNRMENDDSPLGTNEDINSTQTDLNSSASASRPNDASSQGPTSSGISNLLPSQSIFSFAGNSGNANVQRFPFSASENRNQSNLVSVNAACSINESQNNSIRTSNFNTMPRTRGNAVGNRLQFIFSERNRLRPRIPENLLQICQDSSQPQFGFRCSFPTSMRSPASVKADSSGFSSMSRSTAQLYTANSNSSSTTNPTQCHSLTNSESMLPEATNLSFNSLLSTFKFSPTTTINTSGISSTSSSSDNTQIEIENNVPQPSSAAQLLVAEAESSDPMQNIVNAPSTMSDSGPETDSATLLTPVDIQRICSPHNENPPASSELISEAGNRGTCSGNDTQTEKSALQAVLHDSSDDSSLSSPRSDTLSREVTDEDSVTGQMRLVQSSDLLRTFKKAMNELRKLKKSLKMSKANRTTIGVATEKRETIANKSVATSTHVTAEVSNSALNSQGSSVRPKHRIQCSDYGTASTDMAAALPTSPRQPHDDTASPKRHDTLHSQYRRFLKRGGPFRRRLRPRSSAAVGGETAARKAPETPTDDQQRQN
ncbi:flocculation protein FLO11 [Hyalella azteca]|uniref:Flocculation protein FLO11 n=1 Tax=Hyalella azteca TaxID=294128 RepID=A0A8B7N982_HYAAZ|nr:flocculation protein FLO11 [Hyalella azteca]XP_018009864.1 flocculation protein FLO11 [Hyalella azteca]